MDENIQYILINKNKGTQKKIGLILRDIILNRVYFKNNGINKIGKDYRLCKKTLKKYLKEYFLRKAGSTEKRILIKNNIDLQFYKDLEKIINKYKLILEDHTIEKGKFYLNNLK